MASNAFGRLSEVEKTVLVVFLSALTYWIKRAKRENDAKIISLENNGNNNEPCNPKQQQKQQQLRYNNNNNSGGMHFKVAVPERSSPGDTVRIILPDGTEANVVIPTAAGGGGGGTFLCEIPTDQIKDPDLVAKAFEERQSQQQQQSSKSPKAKASRRKSKKQQQGAHPITEIETNPHRPEGTGEDDGISTTRASLLLNDDIVSGDGGAAVSEPVRATSADADAATKKSSSSAVGIQIEDFVFALAVGSLVGAAIVVGFLVGVLHSTEAIYAVHPIEKPKQPLPSRRRHQNHHQQQQQSMHHHQQRMRSFAGSFPAAKSAAAASPLPHPRTTLGEAKEYHVEALQQRL